MEKRSKKLKLSIYQGDWSLSLSLAAQLPQGLLYRLIDAGRELISLQLIGEMLQVAVTTDAHKEPLILETKRVAEPNAPAGQSASTELMSTHGEQSTSSAQHASTTLRLVWVGYRLELWANGKLEDEEWPEGGCLIGDVEEECADGVLQAELTPYQKRQEPECKTIQDILYWAPELEKHNVGDCMPYSDGDTWHLFYLKDRHQHRSKWGKGAHQFAHIATTDFRTWLEYPVAVEITHPWEGSICTGSILAAKEKYYAFYAVRMMDGSSAKVSWAVSDDAVHFTKSEKYFTLKPPYETSSVRDPEVFFGADGKYHMLLTTDWQACEILERSGCLAHMVSDDLEHWEQLEPFLIPGYTDQPECSDYFEWNGWYYLIFSNYGTAKYRYSKKPFGPWICPEQEILDGLLFRVPKTAAFHGRRIAAGFLCINPMGDSYAGSLVLRELVQNLDGTLGTRFVEEILPENSTTAPNFPPLCIQTLADGGYCEQKLEAIDSFLKIKIKPAADCREYGLTVKFADKQAYEIRFQPGQRKVYVAEAHSCLYYNPTKRFLDQVHGLKEEVTLQVILKKGVLDLCINDSRTLVCRLYSKQDDTERICWKAFVRNGAATFERD